MTVDEAAVHAAIMAVNEALDKENSEETFNALSNPNTCLKKLDVENADRYQDLLSQAKKEKAAKCQVSKGVPICWIRLLVKHTIS